MPVQIQFRRDTGSNWASANTVLADGEMGINTTTNQFKIGNGSTAWNSLSYAPISGTVADIDEVTNVTITSATSGQFLKWNGTAWVNDAIDLGTDTTGSYVTSLVAGTGVTLANNSGENATPTVTVDTTVIAPLASPTFTGTVTIPSGASISGFAPLASPTFTGTPTLPTGTIATTQTAADSTTAVATTAFVTTADNLKANLASPTFTGTPTLPTGTIATTQSAGNNATAVATTAFVTAAVAAVSVDFSSDQNILANAVFG